MTTTKPVKLCTGYEWRVLTDDGLLTLPKDVGPTYARDNLNDGAPFDSEDAAINTFEKYLNSPSYIPSVDYTLVKTFRVVRQS
jgi:hypothetical protein